VIDQVLRARPYALVSALCIGLAASNLARPAALQLAVVLAAAALLALAFEGPARIAVLVLLVAGAGWLWGAFRLDRLDRSALAAHVGHVDGTVAEVTGPVRRGEFELRVPVRVRRFGALAVDEPALLELPLGRGPPQGAVIATVAEAKRPRAEQDGFDERAWLRRQGIHVVLHGRDWHAVGRRGGIAGFSDRLRAWLAEGVAPGVGGERGAVIAGVVLGADEGLSRRLRDDFRSSGLYHLLDRAQ